ncbi:MAG: hypothetical protein RJB66_2661 [Pseudomonadota bacterium]|jgi:chemotaxis protein CheX
MAYQFLAGDRHEGYSSSIVKKLMVFPQGKVTHVKEFIDVFRKARAQSFDGIFLTEDIGTMNLGKLVTALRDIEINRRTPIFILSSNPAQYGDLAREFEHVMAIHVETGISDAIQWIENWLLRGQGQEDQETHPPVKIDMRIVKQLIDATKYSIEIFSGVSSVRSMPTENFYKSTRYIDHVSVAGVTAILSTVFAGSILIAFPTDTLLRIVSGALGETCSTFTDEVKSTTGELINIIYSQAKRTLVEDMNMDFMKSRPFVIDEQSRIRSYHGSASYIVPFESEAGRFFLIVAFESIRSSATAE